MEKETRTVSREAVERLKQAESLDDIKEGLRLSPYVWDGSTESLETYGEYVGAVTEKVFGPAGYWECFTPAERRRLVDSVLGSPVNGDATLVSLERAASEGIEGVARAAKEYFAERAGVGATFYALCTRRDCDTDRIKTRWASAVGAVCGLPWVLSNMHMGRIPRELRPEQFIGGALRQCAQGFWSLDIKGRERGTTLIGMLLSRTERVGLSGVAAHVLVECLIKSSEETAAKSKDREMFVHDILRAVGTGSSGGEGLLWAFLDELERSKASGEQKNAWAKGAVSGRVEGGGKTAQKTIVGRFLCVRGREETLGLLVAALNPLGLLQEASKSAVKAWSETFFTAHAGPELDSCTKKKKKNQHDTTFPSLPFFFICTTPIILSRHYNGNMPDVEKHET